MNEEEIEKSKKLCLSDFDKIKTRFCFLDESGSINDETTPFFTIGIVKCTQPFYIASKITYERQSKNFYDEIKFNKLSRLNINFAKKMLDILFSTQSVNVSTYTLDKSGSYFNHEYGEDPWKAYEDISVKLLKSTIGPNEIVIVIADYVTTPREVKFEVNVKRRINQDFGRLSVAGVARFDSTSNDLLQLIDLIIGAINYDLKLSTGIIKSGDKHKRQFVEHLRKNLSARNFVHGFRNYNFNIFVDKDIMQRLPLNYGEE